LLERLLVVLFNSNAVSQPNRFNRFACAGRSRLGADAVILTEEGVLSNGFAMEKWATGVAVKFQ
jgi:hypothetical protein